MGEGETIKIESAYVRYDCKTTLKVTTKLFRDEPINFNCLLLCHSLEHLKQSKTRRSNNKHNNSALQGDSSQTQSFLSLQEATLSISLNSFIHLLMLALMKCQKQPRNNSFPSATISDHNFGCFIPLLMDYRHRISSNS